MTNQPLKAGDHAIVLPISNFGYPFIQATITAIEDEHLPFNIRCSVLDEDDYPFADWELQPHAITLPRTRRRIKF